MSAWREINGFKDYDVSDEGEIRSWKNNKWGRAATSKPLFLIPSTKGYLRSALCMNGKKKMVKAHRLVLETFVGPCPAGMEACHNNGIKTDNRLENLRWDTPMNNQKDRIKHGNSNAGETNASAKLTDIKVVEIRVLLKKNTCVSIAKKYGVGAGAIEKIKKGKTWRHVA